MKTVQLIFGEPQDWQRSWLRMKTHRNSYLVQTLQYPGYVLITAIQFANNVSTAKAHHNARP